MEGPVSREADALLHQITLHRAASVNGECLTRYAALAIHIEPIEPYCAMSLLHVLKAPLLNTSFSMYRAFMTCMLGLML